MQVERAPGLESPEEIYSRVFKELKPRTPTPYFTVEFCPFANPDNFARMEAGRVHIRMTDLLEGAPPAVLEALALILLGKLLRKPVPATYAHRYRLYLNRKDVRRTIDLVRRTRGRKFVSGPQGEHYNLETIFEELNRQHFHGLMARPQLGWSRNRSRTTLGHYDASHHAIILSKLLDDPLYPLAVEYVMFHEMLHLRYPVDTRGARRTVHTREFKKAEREYPKYREAKEVLKKLAGGFEHPPD